MVQTWVISCDIFLIVTFLAFRIFQMDQDLYILLVSGVVIRAKFAPKLNA
jgi:hypothetical protein